MFMRWCTSRPQSPSPPGFSSLRLVLVVTAAAATVLVSPTPAHPTPSPSCVGTDAHAFPLSARIRGGPGSYEPGGGYGTWYIDLTNTTRHTCTGIHPVVVLVDGKRALKPGQPQLDFYDGARARRVSFESTDEQELVGVLDGAGFAGFAVPAGRTVSVKVRLALTSDAVADQVTASAAVVQRRGADGDWVGESNAYRFAIEEGGKGDADLTTPEPGRTQDGGALPPAPTPGTHARTPAPAFPFAETAQEAGERARELSRTGLGLAHGLFAAVLALVAVGGGAFLLARRRR
ncbi:hypothetical protein ACH47Z_07930 [Streptomyces sp. NPDC020192]|uniref:hypothetical protein n=1 Tax=Streptomyces sp. NPDC020192 TaxID=3365066 RepID=UPI0037A3EE91